MTDTDTSPRPPRIWVDADACPGPVKEILFRAAERTQVQVTLVANQWLRTPGSRFVRAIQVQGGFDAADDAIAERAGPGDLVVTQDIPLASRVLAKGAEAVNPRGERFTPDNIAERLSVKPETVKSYLRSAMSKLDAHSRREAVVAARRLGLLP